MLTRLEINNFTIIDEVCLDFSSGLNILTGETGAGKSIILGALKLLLGERASTDSIRVGFDESLIQGIFTIKDNTTITKEIDNLGIADSELIISREINRQGRNLCRINGIVVPVGTLKSIGRYLIDLHGQHEHQSLLDSSKHIEVLDMLCGEEVCNLKSELKDYYTKWQEIVEKLKLYYSDEKDRARKLDLYDFQLKEITSALLKEEEEEGLDKRLDYLSNVEKIHRQTLNAYNELAANGNQESINDNLQNVIAYLDSVAEFEERIKNIKEKLVAAGEVIWETSMQLRIVNDEINIDPQELADVEKRIEEIEKLKKKYGDSIKEILAYAESIEKEKKELEEWDTKKHNLNVERNNIFKKIEDLAGKISIKRKEKAEKIADKVTMHLADLSLENAIFKVGFNQKNATQSGFDNVEFLFSANVGEPLKPLSKIISGGEMSRVMLAIKNIMAEWQWVPTLVFDELDSGIGGKTVQFVGEKILNLSSRHQVICITHWPQIAALADRHFHINKQTKDNKTITSVKHLQGKDIVSEIARMLDGGEKGSLSHANNILKRSGKIKEKK